jgi:hypothetical protein
LLIIRTALSCKLEVQLAVSVGWQDCEHVSC